MNGSSPALIFENSDDRSEARFKRMADSNRDAAQLLLQVRRIAMDELLSSNNTNNKVHPPTITTPTPTPTTTTTTSITTPRYHHRHLEKVRPVHPVTPTLRPRNCMPTGGGDDDDDLLTSNTNTTNTNNTSHGVLVFRRISICNNNNDYSPCSPPPPPPTSEQPVVVPSSVPHHRRCRAVSFHQKDVMPPPLDAPSADISSSSSSFPSLPRWNTTRSLEAVDGLVRVCTRDDDPSSGSDHKEEKEEDGSRDDSIMTNPEDHEDDDDDDASGEKLDSLQFVGNSLGAGVPVRSVLRKKFSWKTFPELEAYLIDHRFRYLECSNAMNYTKAQKQYNNRLTQGLLDLAAVEGYIFEGFTFASVRDRIRCFYKSFVQATKKKKRGGRNSNNSSNKRSRSMTV